MESSTQKSSRKKGATGIALGSLAVLAIIGTVAAMAAGGSKPPLVITPPVIPPVVPPEVPPPTPEPWVPPNEVKPKPDVPPEPPSPDDLTFDLEGNWGGIPMDLRVWLAKAELASGIPGLARAAGVRWWEGFRAKKEPVSTAEAAAIAAANPELARFFVNKNDGAAAKKAIDEDMAKQGWPKPVDYEGWIAGSFGLGDILGSTFVYTGIHTEGKKAGPSGLPFVYASSAKKQYESYEGQIAALAYIVYRILYGPYDVLRPGVQAKPEVQDSEQTWINIFAAYAYPDSYKAKTQLAANAAANYTKRAAEIGINLSKVAYPWPPGLSYKPWDFSDFWARLQAYAPQKVKHLPGVYEANVQMPQNPGIFAQPANKVALQGNVQASIASVIPAGASAPLVIFLHDQDSDESQLAGLVPADMVNARLAFLRAPSKSTLGYRWFEGDLGQINAPSLAAQIDAAANVVSAAGQQLVKLYPGTSEVYVVGFGQGGAIAYRLAARGEVAKVLSIAGGLPPALRLADGKTTKTNVWAVHGSNDQVVPLPIDQQTIESFIFKTPSEAKLAIVNGGVHTLQSLQDQVGAALVEML